MSVVQAGLCLALPSSETEQISSCDDIAAPTTFSLSQISYIKIEQYPTMATVPNSTQLVFTVVNNANGVSTGCSPQNVEVNGQWGDDSNYWYKCVDQSLEVNGDEVPLSTSAHIIWDQWQLSVNQSWSCGDQYVSSLALPKNGNCKIVDKMLSPNTYRSTVRHISTTTLKPSCQETSSAFQYINECTVPDLEATAAIQ
ncbi:uncharacterized protein F4807DRAFT_458722 [Annulohypoxylon truncatum]|uniref:uncharacterized protein n=1 Tax=Annulohypoxylon truncatum TaxID=327061 RepID=UPI002008CCAC|nr:uncharacterized protein F4807DRAFT_458722 [Annulohypoxylon truncatum]KAI1211150.1 hypothetical protein F4807DRAFT_458722 [Annulohypoxylon truncatum]